MKLFSIIGLLGLATITQSTATSTRARRDYANNDYYVLHLERDIEPNDVASRLGLRHEGEVSGLADHHVYRAPKADQDIVQTEIRERKRRKRDLDGHDILDGVLLSKKQEARQRLEKRIIPPSPEGWQPVSRQQPQDWAVEKQNQVMKDLDIHDPIFHEQWHLLNTVQTGHDVNVTGVWLDGVTGHNVTVAIIDDGLDMYSNDLAPNYFAEGSWDFNEHDPEPKPELSDDKHGTRCAGEVAAARNDACGVGVAYDSKIAGIRILSGEISSIDEAEALIYKSDLNHIYSCSWGPPDDGKHMDAPDVIISRAMLKGVQEGRSGLGSIYVFASGNGAMHDDNCNFDGYTNSIYSITVGAVDRAGNHPYYSEHCSANLVVTYSSGSGDAIHTTDVGVNECYSNHGGTSAAAPLAAGIFALALQVNPELSWRDMQYLAMLTAVRVDDEAEEWQETSIGRKFSHTYGYGKIDSWGLVEKAREWTPVKPQAWFFSPWLHIKKDIPEGNDGLVVEFEVTAEMLEEANLERLEHVTVTMNVEHTRRGDISVDLVSPDNVISHIATARKNDEFKGGYDDWTFMSVVHWGESGIGRWSLIVKDNKADNKHTGKFIDWHLKLWGESIDPDKTELLPMPNEDDDADHDVISTTISGPAQTTTVAPAPEETHNDVVVVPTDHPERPTNPSGPSSTDTSDESTGTDVAQETTESAEADSSWVSWLPSFGASKKAQIWIYGAIALIAAFCCGLGIYLWIARKRRLRNDSRNNYEFELLDEEEAEGLNSGEKGAGGKRTRRTRGGELYDAFAGGSDDEEEFDNYSDRSSEPLPGDRAEQHVIGDESDEDDEHEKDTPPLTGSR